MVPSFPQAVKLPLSSSCVLHFATEELWSCKFRFLSEEVFNGGYLGNNVHLALFVALSVYLFTTGYQKLDFTWK